MVSELNEPKMWCSSSPGITSRPREEETLRHCWGLNTMIAEHFYKKVRFDIQKSPFLIYFLNLMHNVEAERRDKDSSASRVCVLRAPSCRLIAHLFIVIRSHRTGLHFFDKRHLKYDDFVKNKPPRWKKISLFFRTGRTEVDTIVPPPPPP